MAAKSNRVLIICVRQVKQLRDDVTSAHSCRVASVASLRDDFICVYSSNTDKALNETKMNLKKHHGTNNTIVSKVFVCEKRFLCAV